MPLPLWNHRQPTNSSIRDYLKNAVLPRITIAQNTPKIPEYYHLSYNIKLLGVRPERNRRLRKIIKVNTRAVERSQLDFVEKHIAHVSMTTPKNGASLHIPCDGYKVNEVADSFPPLCHVAQLTSYWVRSILRTIEHILAVIPEYQETIKKYNFATPDLKFDLDPDLDDFQYTIWKRKSFQPGNHEVGEKADFIVAIMPVWSLSPTDMYRFTSTVTLPLYDANCGINQPRYNSAHRIWAKIHDICKKNQCHHFALTNYHDWVFGGFSQSYEYGFIGEMKVTVVTDDSPQSDPTVLETLIFWIISSMGLPDGIRFPVVIESSNLDTIDDDGICTPRTLSPAPSVSVTDWSRSEYLAGAGQSDIASSAGVYEDVSLESDHGFSKNENWQQHAKGSMLRNSSKVTSEWLKGVRYTEAPDTPPMPTVRLRSASPAVSDFSDMSTAARVPYRGQEITMMGPIEEAAEDDYLDVDRDMNDAHYFSCPSREHDIVPTLPPGFFMR